MKRKMRGLAAATLLSALCIGGCLCGCSVKVTTNAGSGSDTITIDSSTPLTTMTESFDEATELSIDLNYGDLNITTGDTLSVTCIYPDSLMPKAECSNGVLTVESTSAENITINGTLPEISTTITIPSGTSFSAVTIKTGLGTMSLDSVIAQKLDAQNNMGDIIMKSCTFQTVSIEDDMGSITGTGLDITAGTIHSDMGDVNLTGSLGSVKSSTDLGTVTLNGSKQ